MHVRDPDASLEDWEAVGILLLVGLGVKLILFHDVAVNGDTGLYIYDAQQLHMGHRLFLDFPSRSPIFQYALAAALPLHESPIVAARAMMVAWSLLVATGIYAVARELRGHATGLVAMALYLFQPFPAVWSLWVKTEVAAAALALAAIALALHYIDDHRIPARVAAGVGVLLASAILVRRVAIVHLGVLALWTLYYRTRHHDIPVRQTLRTGLTAALGVGGTLAAAYVLLARGDPGIAYANFEQHLVALFASQGMGSLGYIPLDYLKSPTPEITTGLIGLVCQKCGLNTVKIFVRTMLVTLPLTILLLIPLRAWWDATTGQTLRVVLPWLLVIEAGLALVYLHAVDLRALGVLMFIAGVILVWQLDLPRLNQLYDRRLALPILLALALAAGYLYRDRVLYITYYQDLYPWLAILAATTIVPTLRPHLTTGWRPPSRQQALTAGLLGLLVAATVLGGVFAYPYQPGGVDDPGSAWFSTTDVQRYGQDINARTMPGDRVFTAQPLYVVESDRRLVADLSRKYYLFQAWQHAPVTDRVATHITSQLESGQAPVAVVDSETKTVLEHDRIRRVFMAHYCPAATDDSLYAATNATLWHYNPQKAPSCHA